jgi:hypothetical protein
MANTHSGAIRPHGRLYDRGDSKRDAILRREVVLMSGDGYGVRSCAYDGCRAVLAYPDEGEVCPDHACDACGGVGEWYADNNGASIMALFCDACDEQRAERYGCARIIAEGCGCDNGGGVCPCGCDGAGVLTPAP